MGASPQEIYLYVKNTVQRASYGVNGRKHFEIQRKRMIDMAAGGSGGSPGNSIMSDTSGHHGTVRAMHFDDWEDSDFQKALDDIAHWETHGELPPAPPEEAIDPVKEAVQRAHAILSTLDRDAQIDALNGLAEALGVMEPDQGDEGE